MAEPCRRHTMHTYDETIYLPGPSSADVSHSMCLTSEEEKSRMVKQHCRCQCSVQIRGVDMQIRGTSRYIDASKVSGTSCFSCLERTIPA